MEYEIEIYESFPDHFTGNSHLNTGIRNAMIEFVSLFQAGGNGWVFILCHQTLNYRYRPVVTYLE